MTELILRHDRASAGAALDGLARPGERGAHGLPHQDLALADTKGLELSLVSSLDAFHALEGEWDALFQDCATPAQTFQSYAWCWHWCRHYLAAGRRAGPRLAIVTGRLGGRLALVLPLATERRAGLVHLAWLGEPVSQYGDIIATPAARDPEHLAAAWRFAVAATGADVANLRKVRADSIAATLLRQTGASVTAVEEAPYIDLTRSPTFAAFEDALPGKGRRKNRRRQMRRLEERGAVEFEVHAGTDDAAHLADYAIRLKRAWLKDRDYISPALADDRFAAFFADVAHGRGKPVGAKVLAVRSAGEVAALDIVIDCKSARFLHVAVFASKFDKTGAGALLLENAIARTYDDGLATFDMLAPKHDYKLDYTQATIAVEDHALALTLKGRVWTDGFLAFRRRLKHAVETMPAPVRRLIAGTLALAKRGR